MPLNMNLSAGQGPQAANLVAGPGVTISGSTVSSSFGVPNGVPYLGIDGFIGGPGGTALSNLVSPTDPQFGAVGDFNMTGASITIASGTLNQGTITSVSSDLVAGKTMVINGIPNPLVIQSVVGTTVTFTGNATATTTGSAMCAWGTDNTNALNNWILYLLLNNKVGLWPNGKYLITNTIGRPDGQVTGYSSLLIYAGGAPINSVRLANLSRSGGTTVVWGGVAGGTMMSFNRVDSFNVEGGISFVGQPSYDPASTFTTFGNRAGIGWLLSQNGSPTTGTGYGKFGDVLFGDMDVGVQFAENVNDNNCDTTRFERFRAWRCTCAGIASGAQQMAFTFGFAHFVGCNRGFVANGGGFIDLQQLNISACTPSTGRLDGAATAVSGTTTVFDSAILASDAGRSVTAVNVPTLTSVQTITPGVSFTINNSTTGTVGSVTLGATYCGLELHSGVNASSSHVGSMRCETNSYNLAYIGGSSLLEIDTFMEAQTNATNLTLFLIDGGTNQGGLLGIKQCIVYSHSSTSGQRPFSIASGSAKSGQLVIDQAIFTTPITLSQLFDVTPASWTDITIRKIRDTLGNTYNSFKTKLAMGETLYTYAKTTDATTAVGFSFTGASLSTDGYAPRIPKGYSIIRITIIGDHGDGTFSLFQRDLFAWRTTGAATIVSNSAATGWSDSIVGTDQISLGPTVDANQIININVKGTVGTTVNWQATHQVIGFTSAVDV